MSESDVADRALTILHVGSGHRPLRWGGLAAYIEDLMSAQVGDGHSVAYFFTGRYFRWPRSARLKRWSRGEIHMLEVINSPLYDHGRQPRLEVSEPQTEGLFAAELERVRPDLVHVHELAGLPSSVLDIARNADVPVTMTLQDYFPLCSTFKLLDAHGEVCLRREIGADCVASVRSETRPTNLLFEVSLRHALNRQKPIQSLSPKRREAIVERFVRSPLARPSREQEPFSPEDFQRRRELNVERLNSIDRVVAMSSRVAEIYSQLGVRDEVLTTMRLTLDHVSKLSVREPSGTQPVTFATLGGGESPAKGSRLLAQAVRTIAQSAGSDQVRLLIFGQCEPGLEEAVADLDWVERRGIYRAHQLDGLLDEVDVGLMPSIWEEAYGYAGIELIAKGIPVVANRIGGMVDYVREGETGWFNPSNSARGLAELMLRLVEAPEQVAAVAASTRAARPTLVEPMSKHAADVEDLYRELLAA